MQNIFKKLILILILAIIANFSGISPGFSTKTNIPLRNKIDEDLAGIQLRGGVKIDHKEQLVTLSLRYSNLEQVLRMLADKAGMNIILHEVHGTITLDLVDVELNKAFEYIMTMNNLTYWKDGNTLIVASNEIAEELGINMSQIKSIKVKYSDAQKVADFLNENVFSVNRPYTSTSSIVTSNPNTNDVLVFGKDEDIELAREVIEYLDVKPQVKSYEINFADPVSIATKICWAVFKSEDGEEEITIDSDLEEGSESKLVCGNTSELEETDSDGDLEAFNNPLYWVLADTGLNQVTVYGGTSEQLVMADEIIKNFDKREPQVYMEISIIELNEDGSKSLASSMSYFRNRSKFTLSDGNLIVDHIANTSFTDDLYINSENGRVDKIFTSQLKSLITQDKGRLLANPRVIAANNTVANINISSEVVETRDAEIDPDLNTVDTTVTIGDGDSISFSILPKISPNGFITLSLSEFTFNTIKGTVTDASGNLIATLKNSRDVEAKKVRVKDGDTFIIGGLIQESEQISHKKVPLLGDLPIIGSLFQNQATEKKRSELIIMITPRILKDVDEIEPV